MLKLEGRRQNNFNKEEKQIENATAKQKLHITCQKLTFKIHFFGTFWRQSTQPRSRPLAKDFHGHSATVRCIVTCCVRKEGKEGAFELHSTRYSGLTQRNDDVRCSRGCQASLSCVKAKEHATQRFRIVGIADGYGIRM